ncbi:hypothetical protein Agub_g11829, partial [Astrephomene gubernaculifera]
SSGCPIKPLPCARRYARPCARTEATLGCERATGSNSVYDIHDRSLVNQRSAYVIYPVSATCSMFAVVRNRVLAFAAYQPACVANQLIRYTASSRDVDELNQELNDFFGVAYVDSAAADHPPNTGRGDKGSQARPHATTAAAAEPTPNQRRPGKSGNSPDISTQHNATTPAARGSLEPSHRPNHGFAASARDEAEAEGRPDLGRPHRPYGNSYDSSAVQWSASSSESQEEARTQRLQPFSAGRGEGDGEVDEPQQQQRRLTHIDSSGSASMVDVSQKAVTTREAQASCVVSLSDAFEAVAANSLAKGDVLRVAQLAGIGGAKATANLIPLCHNIPISKVDVQLHLDAPSRSVIIRALARTDGKTGVEMEALTAAAVAALTVYDMCKAAAKDMVVGPLQLDYKAGGRSGTYLRAGLRRGDLLPSARPPL